MCILIERVFKLRSNLAAQRKMRMVHSGKLLGVVAHEPEQWWTTRAPLDVLMGALRQASGQSSAQPC